MANYSNLQAAIDAGTNNMQILRNGTKNDDNTTTYNTGIDWFKFNNQTVSKVYSNGNSYVGLGANNTNNAIKINNRDGAVWYEYQETGKISGVDFYRFRWEGYSRYNSTSSECRQKFEFFLFNSINKEIYIRYITKPTSNEDGDYSLTCNGTSLSLNNIRSNMEITLIPNNKENGTDWTISSSLRPIFKANKGVALYNITFVSKDKEMILWDQTVPTDTDLKVYYKLSTDTDYTLISSGYILTKLIKNQSYTINIKIEMSKKVEVESSPTLSNLRILSGDDRKKIYINLSEPVTVPLTDPIDVTYDGLGGLQGYGGIVPVYNGQIPIN